MCPAAEHSCRLPLPVAATQSVLQGWSLHTDRLPGGRYWPGGFPCNNHTRPRAPPGRTCSRRPPPRPPRAARGTPASRRAAVRPGCRPPNPGKRAGGRSVSGGGGTLGCSRCCRCQTLSVSLSLFVSVSVAVGAIIYSARLAGTDVTFFYSIPSFGMCQRMSCQHLNQPCVAG